MAKFRKNPVVIEAVQFTGDNAAAVAAWAGKGGEWGLPPDATRKPAFVIPTLEGPMVASSGDWIIRGIKGEFYPCKPDIFAATYDPAE